MSGSLRANHSRWCEKNPKSEAYKKSLAHARSFFIFTDSHREKIKTAHKDGKYDYSKMGTPGRRVSEESRSKMSEAALKCKHRRLRKSINEFIKSDGTTVLLDSSWERLLAVRLDFLEIEWLRPEIPIEWIDKKGKIHNYFPDFYLPNFDLYLDPKNPFAMVQQKDKLQIIRKTIPNLLIIETEKECKEFSPF